MQSSIKGDFVSLIKAVIWDLAGVVLHPIKGTFNTLLAERLGVTSNEIDRIMDGKENELWDIDEINDDTFYSFVLKELNLPIEKKSIIKRFVVKDFYIDQKILAFIKKVKQSCTTVLLTNFPAHLHEFIKTDWSLEGAFDHLIASCDVKLIKPDPQIYKLTLDRIKYKAEECIFIDDRSVNVKAAVDIGIYGIEYLNRDQVVTDVEKLLRC